MSDTKSERISALESVLREVRMRLAVPIAGATVEMLNRRDLALVKEITDALGDSIRDASLD